MQDFDALLEQAQLPEQQVQICLRGDLLVRFAELERELATASTATNESLASGAVPRELAERMEAVREEMHEGSVTFTLRALSEQAWRAILKLHPAQVDNYADLRAGFNRETMGPALIKVCVVEPKLSPDQWTKLRDKLSPAEWSKLDKAASDLNFEAVSIPFSEAASQILSSGSE